jgi:hypothetical protein
MTDFAAIELIRRWADALDSADNDTGLLNLNRRLLIGDAYAYLDAQPEPAGPTAAIEQAWKRHSKIPTFNDEEVLSPEGFRAAVAEIFGAAQPQPAEWRLVVDSDGKPIGRLTASGELEPWDQ